MQVFTLLSLFTFFVGVHSLALERRSCVSPDVTAIAQQVSDPHYFCAWYLSDGRTKSPIPNINVDALVIACRCVASVEPAGTHAKLLADITKAARLQSFVDATCPSISANPIAKEFRDASSFCAFFNSFERHDSPIPNLNTPAVRQACRCVLNGPQSTTGSSSTKKVSSATKHTTSKLFSKSTQAPTPKTSATVTKESSSKRISSKTSSSKISTKSSFRQSSSSKPSSTKASSSKSSSSKISKLSSSTRVPSSHTPSSRMSSSSVRTHSSSTSLRDVYQVITSQHLEAFCTTYLGYTTPYTTKTTTLFVSAATTKTLKTTTTSKIRTITTETDVIGTITVTTTVRTSYAAPAPTKKRALETPSALRSYLERAVSSGCSRAATAPPTRTILQSVMVTSTEIVRSTLTTVAYEYDLSTVKELATSTITSISPLYTDTPCGNQPAGSTWYGPFYEPNRWSLYCHSYGIVGVSHYSNTGDLAGCMGLCDDFSAWCKGVKQSNGNCWLYDDFEISPFGNSSVAVRIG